MAAAPERHFLTTDLVKQIEVCSGQRTWRAATDFLEGTCDETSNLLAKLASKLASSKLFQNKRFRKKMGQLAVHGERQRGRRETRRPHVARLDGRFVNR